MNETNDETRKRIAALEETTSWLKDRVWFGTGNLHDRVHNLEDRSADRSFEIEAIKEDVKNIKSVVGLEGYGGRNLISDLTAALDSIEKIKGGLITVKDFQTLMQDVDTLKKRGQAQIKFLDYVMFAVVGVIVTALTNAVIAKLFGTLP